MFKQPQISNSARIREKTIPSRPQICPARIIGEIFAGHFKYRRAQTVSSHHFVTSKMEPISTDTIGPPGFVTTIRYIGKMPDASNNVEPPMVSSHNFVTSKLRSSRTRKGLQERSSTNTRRNKHSSVPESRTARSREDS